MNGAWWLHRRPAPVAAPEPDWTPGEVVEGVTVRRFAEKTSAFVSLDVGESAARPRVLYDDALRVVPDTVDG